MRWLNEPAHESLNSSPESCVDDMAVFLGIALASMQLTEMQVGCYLYSVLKLAKLSGVSKNRALRPFDVTSELATRIWDELENEETMTFTQIRGLYNRSKTPVQLEQVGNFQLFLKGSWPDAENEGERKQRLLFQIQPQIAAKAEGEGLIRCHQALADQKTKYERWLAKLRVK